VIYEIDGEEVLRREEENKHQSARHGVSWAQYSKAEARVYNQ
jgi:hypothetical protein